MLVIIILVLIVAFFIDLQRDRWPQARRFSSFLVGALVVSVAIYILVGTYSDAVSGRSVDITRSGARSVVTVGSRPFWFWVSIAGKAVGGACILFLGSSVLYKSIINRYEF